jgi:hypothetical protein
LTDSLSIWAGKVWPRRILELAKRKPLDISALLISLTALGLSLVSFIREPERQSDQLTSEMIRNAYSDFIAMVDLRTQHPLQSHLFEVPGGYGDTRNKVVAATSELRSKPAELARLSLEERAVADRLFTMFEQAFYQWKQARDRGDTPRAKFLDEVLAYFTGRLLKNPRLLWFWSSSGGNLSVHYEDETIRYFDEKVKPDYSKWDQVGPFK